MSFDPRTAETLLEESHWIRSLARQLVADAHRAEDLAQDTYLLALRHEPWRRGPIRAWVRIVMKRLARQRRRRDDVERRTLGTSRLEPGTSPGSDEIAERAATHHAVVGALLRLDEPYRSTLIRRWLDERSPRSIASEDGVPLATVRTRLQRGLTRLREDLERCLHPEERGAWLFLLSEIGRPRGTSLVTSSALILGTLAMKIPLSVCLALAFLLGAYFLVFDSSPNDVSLGKPVVHAEEAAADPARDVPEGSTRRERDEGPSRPVRAANASGSPSSPPPEAAAILHRGRLLDPRGRGLSELSIGFRRNGVEEPLPVAKTDWEGSFSFQGSPGEGGTLVVLDDGYTTVASGLLRPGDRQVDPVVLAARSITVGGTVYDPTGRPVEEALVRLELPEGFRARFDVVLDESAVERWETRTSAEGRWVLLHLPAIEGAKLRASREGWTDAEAPSPSHDLDPLDFHLGSIAPGPSVVEGRVVDASGRPVAEARVSLGLEVTSTDASGTFRFDLAAENSINARLSIPPTTLQAVKAGFLPARLDHPGSWSPGENPWTEPVILTLGGAALTLGGRVLGPDGEPAEGVRVWLQDATLFGAVDRRPCLLEGMIAGEEEGTRLWSYRETDEQGRFELRGLLDRPYVVEAMDPNTMLRIASPPVRPRSDELILRLPAEGLHPRIEGRIVSDRGEPIEGIRVRPMCDTFVARLGERPLATAHHATDGVTTDEQGLFVLENVPKNLVYLRLDGDAILPLEYGRGLVGGFAERSQRSVLDLRIVVPLRCRVQVTWNDPTRADTIAMLDEEGRELVLDVVEGTSRRSTERLPLTEGRSQVFSVSDSARTLVFFLGAEEVERHSVALRPGDVNSLHH